MLVRLNSQYLHLLKEYNGVILDTSFIIQCIDEKGDILNQLEQTTSLPILIPESVINELKRLTKAIGKKGNKALLALKLAKRYKVIRSTTSNVDEDIINLSRNSKFIVATTDSKIRRKLKFHNILTIYLSKDGELFLD